MRQGLNEDYNKKLIFSCDGHSLFQYLLIFVSFPFFQTLGECINSSPAGKRRIAAEKQLSQLADEGNLFNVDAALIDGGGGLMANDGGNTMDQVRAPVTFVAALAICSVGVIIFVTIFTVVQVCDPFILSHCVYVLYGQ